MKNKLFKIQILIVAICIMSGSLSGGEGWGEVFAATKKPLVKTNLPKIPSYSVSAWIPYWKGQQAVDEAVKNIKKIDIMSPFAYEVNETGVLQDKLKLDQAPFDGLIKSARDNKKLIVPTILWTDKKSMETTLADVELRSVIIHDILVEIKKHKLDGIDIDFEGKSAETKESFSAFIKEANKALHRQNKLLICTIESRIPLDSRFATVTPEIAKTMEYSNDFKVMNKYCDQVRFMAYDQMTTDLKLNIEKGKTVNGQTDFYKPVADIDWVEKVITLAMWDIKWSKIVIGVPTYGNKYEVVRSANTNINTVNNSTSSNIVNNAISYKFIGSMNWFYADQKAKELNIIPTRNKAGELSFTYKENKNGIDHEYLIWYSDAEAIADKVNIAKLYKVGGIAIFKVDGNNDPDIWNKVR